MGKKRSSKRTFYTIISGIFILIAIYLLVNSLGYMWAVYKSLFEQVGWWVTLISFVLTFELGMFGCAALFVPVSNLLDENITLKKMLQSNVVAVIANILLVQVAFPNWNGLIVVILYKIFGFNVN